MMLFGVWYKIMKKAHLSQITGKSGSCDTDICRLFAAIPVTC